MQRGNWPVILFILFLALLGWYLIYTERIISALRADAETMTRMYSEVQAGLAEPEVGGVDPAAVRLQALVRLQEIILESGVPLVLSGEGDSILEAVNLPFEAELETGEGQARVREYARRLDRRNPPVGQPETGRVHFGDPPELQRLRWIPWLQVSGLLLTFVLGIAVIRSQRQADAERAWTAMARELAHQLATPISSLQGWLELLRMDTGGRPAGVDDTEIAGEIGEDVVRLERISRRFELIGREVALEPVEVPELLAGLRSYLQARLPRLGPGVELEFDVPDDIPPIQGNEVLLSWALENLVKNAVDALAGTGGRITVRGSYDGESVILRVEDTGPGVEAQVRERIFEAGVSTKAGGWGVGLALTRRIVERVHDGKVELLAGTGKGAVFRMTLPAVDG